jgi:RNA polymerase sigma-70 factor, ECF subfamily
VVQGFQLSPSRLDIYWGKTVQFFRFGPLESLNSGGWFAAMDWKGDVTVLLSQIHDGDDQAAARLFPIVYKELRRVAAGVMRRQPPGHTLQPTAVVHEAYLRMMGGTSLNPGNRTHFFAVAARCMRQVLVDHARHKLAGKRGGEMQHRVELEEDLALTAQQSEEVLALHEALERLQSLDARQAQIVEMHYFAGNLVDEIATACNLSERTVKRELQTARLFLKQQLERKGLQL